jgi:hypothetical protein
MRMKGVCSMPKKFELRAVVVSVGVMVIAASLNVLVDAGAVLHDIFCRTHGTFS